MMRAGLVFAVKKAFQAHWAKSYKNLTVSAYIVGRKKLLAFKGSRPKNLGRPNDRGPKEKENCRL